MVVISSTKSSWDTLVCVPEVNTEAIWFSIFVHNLSDGTECTFSKIVDDTKLPKRRA